MGYMRNHAIVVTDRGHGELIEEAHAYASYLFRWVSPISPETTNGLRSFFVPPDGSKERWDESEIGDKQRDALINWLEKQKYEDGSSPLSWVEVQFGDDLHENKICRANDLAPIEQQEPGGNHDAG